MEEKPSPDLTNNHKKGQGIQTKKPQNVSQKEVSLRTKQKLRPSGSKT
jgi:hypothetical protein